MKIHIHHGKAKDAATPDQIQQAKRAAGTAVVAAQGKCADLKRILTDRDDKAEVDNAISYLKSALNKLTEVQEG